MAGNFLLSPSASVNFSFQPLARGGYRVFLQEKTKAAKGHPFLAALFPLFASVNSGFGCLGLR